MIVTFEKEYLRDLYVYGFTNDKKHRFQPDIIKRYRRCIKILENSEKILDLYYFNSLNLEDLQGNKLGISSIRVNKKYRIEFTVEINKTDVFLTICNIIELSNHYK